VAKFQPEHLEITFDKNVVVVEGKRETITDPNNSFTNSFVWRFSLPAGVKPEDVVQDLSDDGVLTLSAPLPQPKLNVQTVFSGLPQKSKKEKKIKSKN
jgi:HSP20 family molecular chaperone IbpA